MKSEFGKGLTYNLGLFLAHQMQNNGFPPEIKKHLRVSSWFNGASDHLFELQWQQAPTEILKEKCKRLQDKCLKWRLPLSDKEPANQDREWALNETREILMEIDKYLKVDVEKGEWE